MELQNRLAVRAITFDDFHTLRYPVNPKKDIIHVILKQLRQQGLNLNIRMFLNQYGVENEHYQEERRNTLRESLLECVVLRALAACGYESEAIEKIVREAIDRGRESRRIKWFPNAKQTLRKLREKGYRLGLISNTRLRVSEDQMREYARFFDAVTLSYEHGYVKPHPSIFIVTLNKLRVDANQCLHVGDNQISDVLGPRNVGIKTAFINRGKAKTCADIEIRCLTELLSYV